MACKSTADSSTGGGTGEKPPPMDQLGERSPCGKPFMFGWAERGVPPRVGERRPAQGALRGGLAHRSLPYAILRPNLISRVDCSHGDGTTHLNRLYSGCCFMPSIALIEFAMLVKLPSASAFATRPSLDPTHLTNAQFFSLSRLTSSISPYCEKSARILAYGDKDQHEPLSTAT